MTGVSNRHISPGHHACAGCGQMVAVQAVMRGLSEDTILVNATGCLEVTTSAHPHSAWRLPWIHSLFENSAPIATGIKAALEQNNRDTKVVVQAGDGATFDIGFGFLSGLWERKDKVLYICYDTESYSNTGAQASGATPFGASSATTPLGQKSIGSEQQKKDMLQVALAHKVPYIAQSTAAFPDDITRKVKEALATDGPSYIQILSPCGPGWGIKPNEAIKAGRLAVQTGLYPLLSYKNGNLESSSIKANSAFKPVAEYLNMQRRFKKAKKETVAKIQKLADENKKNYQL